MALIRVDWNPPPKKIREFGILLGLFLLLISWKTWRSGHAEAAAAIASAAVILDTVISMFPAAGLKIYRAWMAVAFVMGTVVSTVMLIVLYYGIVTPLGLLFRCMGRDALGLRGGKETYWTPLNIPEEKTYYERLF